MRNIFQACKKVLLGLAIMAIIASFIVGAIFAGYLICDQYPVIGIGIVVLSVAYIIGKAEYDG